ncbi:MAG: hypothetical protein ACAH89_03190, partial [Rariglobus sp.]
LAVLRVPAVQTWLAKRLVASQPGWSLEAERIDIGPGGLEAHGIDFSMPGLTAKSDPISVRVAPGRLLRREFAVQQISVNQLNIEITPAKFTASPAGAPAAGPFTGVLELLQAPLAWTLAKTDIKARVGVREGSQTVATGDLTLSGGGFTPDSPGTFTYDLTAASALLPAGPDNVIRSHGTVRIVQNATHGIASIELKGDLRLPSYGAFTPPPATLNLLVENTPTGERYQADLKFGDEARLTILSSLNPRDNYTGFDLQFSGKPAFLARLDPRLAQIGAWQAHLTSLLNLQSATPAPRNTQLTVKGDTTPFRFILAQKDAAHSAQIELSGLPLTWANPWLADSGVQLTAGTLAGKWLAELKPDNTLTATPVAPLTLGPITLTSDKLPPLLPVTVALSPRLTLSKETVSVSADDFTATTEKGDRVAAQFALTHTLATAHSHTTGSLSGALPTLLAGPDHPLPFLVAARWDAALETDGATQLDALEFIARIAADSAPCVSLSLQQPLRLGSTAAIASLKSDSAQDLLRFSVKNLPLAWLSRWAPGVALDGEWAAGESVLRHASEGGGFIFITRAPWSFTGLTAISDGETLFSGDAHLEPEFSYSETLWSARLHSFAVTETAGRRASGEASFDWTPAKKAFAASLNLDAKLPALPHSVGTFGALDVTLKAKANTVDGKVAQMEHLDLSIRNAAGPLLTLATTQPFLFVRKPSGETIFSSYGPLRLQTTPIPLTWAQPWLPPGMAVTGTLGATDLLLHAEPQKFRLRPLKPLTVENLSVTRDGVTTISDARLSFFPGVDMQLLHQLLPTFQLVYQGRVHATEGQLDLGGRRAADFETALGFLGNPETTLPQSVDLQALLDLGAFDKTREGRVVARLNGDLLGGEPLDFWARLDRVKSLPALEVSAHGKVDGRQREAGFDVSMQYFTTPVTSDAAFRVNLGMDSGTLNFDSALHSKFMDVTAALELAEAFQPATIPASAKTAAPAVANSTTSTPPREKSKSVERMAKLGKPFWSVLRGHFDLDLGTVAFTPYRIDAVRGRIDVAETKLTLSGLTGTMFAGKWSGSLGIDYNPAGESDHFLKGSFHIEQFETARVVQTAFPNEFGSFDARINLDATVRSDGNSVWELLNRAEGDFAIEGRDGVARLTHPAAGTASTLLVLGGAVSFSPELRALGRLLRKFAEMPVNTLRVSGERDATGNITLTEFRLDSPQARLIGRGTVPMEDGVALAGRRLDLGLELFARDEVGVILGNMKLLEKHPGVDGYRRMTQPVTVGGEVGRPDASPLYDLLARGALGSRGTWGLIMRKVQREVEKQRLAEAKKAKP